MILRDTLEVRPLAAKHVAAALRIAGRGEGRPRGRGAGAPSFDRVAAEDLCDGRAVWSPAPQLVPPCTNADVCDSSVFRKRESEEMILHELSSDFRASMLQYHYQEAAASSSF